MTIFPLANLDNYGARIEADRELIRVHTVSGKVMSLPHPPESMFIEKHPDAIEASRTVPAAWAAQKLVENVARFDAEQNAVNRDHRFSEIGKAEKLLPIRRTAVILTANVMDTLLKHETAIAKAEQDRYAVPVLHPGDLAGALHDMEVRQRMYPMSVTELNEFMRPILDGQDSKGRKLLEPILRSPFSFGNLEKVAIQGFRDMRDREDPDGRYLLNVATEHLDWGRRVTSVAKAMLMPELAFEPEELYSLVQPFALSEFFAPDQIAYLSLRAKYKAA